MSSQKSPRFFLRKSSVSCFINFSRSSFWTFSKDSFRIFFGKLIENFFKVSSGFFKNDSRKSPPSQISPKIPKESPINSFRNYFSNSFITSLNTPSFFGKFRQRLLLNFLVCFLKKLRFRDFVFTVLSMNSLRMASMD